MRPELPKNVGLFFAALYATGLLISQMHLGKYGISGFAFNDARYIFTGAWFLLSLLPICSLVGLIELCLPRKEAWVRREIAVAMLVTPIAFSLLLASTMQLSSTNDPITVRLSEFLADYRRTSDDTAVWFLMPWAIDVLLIVVSPIYRSARILIARLFKTPRDMEGESERRLVPFRARRSLRLGIWLVFCSILHSFSYLTWMHEDIKQAYGGGSSFYGCIEGEGGQVTVVSIVHETDDSVYYIGSYSPDPFVRFDAAELCGVPDAEDGTKLLPDIVYRGKAEDLRSRVVSSPND